MPNLIIEVLTAMYVYLVQVVQEFCSKWIITFGKTDFSIFHNGKIGPLKRTWSANLIYFFYPFNFVIFFFNIRIFVLVWFLLSGHDEWLRSKWLTHFRMVNKIMLVIHPVNPLREKFKNYVNDRVLMHKRKKQCARTKSCIFNYV